MDLLIANEDVFVARCNKPCLVHAEHAPSSIRPVRIEQVRDPASDDNGRPVPLHGRDRIQLLNVLPVGHGRLSNLPVMRLDRGLFLLAVVCCRNGEGSCERTMPSADLNGCLALDTSSKEIAQLFSGEAIQAVAHAEHKPFLRRGAFKGSSGDHTKPPVAIQQQARYVSHARGVGEIHVHGVHCYRTTKTARRSHALRIAAASLGSRQRCHRCLDVFAARLPKAVTARVSFDWHEPSGSGKGVWTVSTAGALKGTWGRGSADSGVGKWELSKKP